MTYNIFKKKYEELREGFQSDQSLPKGISIIIPVYNAGDFLATCLNSLSDQKIYDAKFEVILILNGHFKEDYNNLIFDNPVYFLDLDLTILINDNAGAGSARNLGIKNAKYSHITFIDIDDYVSESYIQANYNVLKSDTISFTQIFDDVDGLIYKNNLLNTEIQNAQDNKNVKLMDLIRISTITACKIIPKKMLVLQKFKEHLRSGEDTVYFSELFVNCRPKLYVLPLDEKAIYYRRIRENSVSRKKDSFDFLIFQRLEIIEILDRILNNETNATLTSFIRSKYNAQIHFMNKYLKNNLEEREKIVKAIDNLSLNHFNYSILNQGIADTLIVSYCFPPFSDTSASIVSKRILNNNKVVDVVSNNMSKIRGKDLSLNNMVTPLVAEKVTVNVQASFSNMFYLNSYINESFSLFLKNEKRYENIYSRAMFPVSHISPLFMKIINPNVRWVAEFSDPLLYNIDSIKRSVSVDNDVFVQSLKNGLLGNFSKYVDNNLFNIAELIPFALADKVIFTNENQLEYMITRFNEKEKAIIRGKAEVLKHPTLNKNYYEFDEVNLKLEYAVINIAYFGNFYSKRGVKQFIDLLDYLNERYDSVFKLYLYTNVVDLTQEENDLLEKHNSININSYLPFPQFLNACTKFDVLLISDANTKKDKPFNPYLPSKLSDYLGSMTPILALTEKTSPMAKINLDRVFKIDTVDFEKEIQNSLLPNNITLHNLISFVEKNQLKRTHRVLLSNKKGSRLIDNNYEMSLTKNLSLYSIEEKQWLILPKSLPVKAHRDYKIQIINKGNDKKCVELKSFYNLAKNIKVDIIIDTAEKSKKSNIWLSELKGNYNKIDIPANGKLIIRLIYTSDRNLVSFLNAGRLQMRYL